MFAPGPPGGGARADHQGAPEAPSMLSGYYFYTSQVRFLSVSTAALYSYIKQRGGGGLLLVLSDILKLHLAAKNK